MNKISELIDKIHNNSIFNAKILIMEYAAYVEKETIDKYLKGVYRTPLLPNEVYSGEEIDKFIVIEVFDSLFPTIVTNTEGLPLVFETYIKAQEEANNCQKGIVIRIE